MHLKVFKIKLPIEHKALLPYFTTTYKSLLIFSASFVVCPTFSEKTSFTDFLSVPKNIYL